MYFRAVIRKAWKMQALPGSEHLAGTRVYGLTLRFTDLRQEERDGCKDQERR